MQVVHGTWIPDDTKDFVQRGGFFLWVETDVSLRARRRPSDGSLHPRHLIDASLVAFLDEKLGIRDSYSRVISRAFCRRFFLLPSANGAPLPSFELQRYVDEEIPDSFELASWQVCCYPVPDFIRTLNDIHFVATNAAEDFQLGADFLFWHQFGQLIKQVIAREQYIPAIKYQEIVPNSGKRAKSAPTFELHPGWEMLSHLYDAAIPKYVAAMPTLCAAGSTTPATEVHTKESLLRHFGECLLHDVVTGTPLTAKSDRQLSGTFLYRAIYPYRPDARHGSPADELTEYRAWAGWRERLTQAQTAAGFTLGFQLEEATDVDDWQLHFQVAAKHDPSHRLRLADYWGLEPKARANLSRPFGSDFEKLLLLGLGHAARIYPELWRGLETSRPAGFRLTLGEAFSFLKENAWILEDAGYTVSVPAWWTPQGRRRAKLRLKTAQRPAKGKTGSGSGYLSFDSIVAYQYELSIGDAVVSEEEWRQLVEAKSPLVRFRGQWMELDRDRMQQLLEFWQTHHNAEPELTIRDLLKATADAEDDLEWDHDPALQSMLSRLQDKSTFAPIEDPPELQGSLRDYQRRGVAWLGYLESLGLNPCLADDMGLGKTVEVIALLLDERRSAKTVGPTLVIAPTSVLGNWRKEIGRFAPSLRTLVHQGSIRNKDERLFRDACRDCDVVITSFALARLDEKLLRGVNWGRVVVDEAQNIKNPHAAQTRAIAKLAAPRRLALTGTPVENRLRDLWAIFNFLNPGYLGKEAQFRKSFELPIQKDNDSARAATLKRLVEPFILRRVKTDQRIIADLPEKIEQKLYCQLTPEQASLYSAVVKDVEEQLGEVDGIRRKGLILTTLLRLKQVCNHPAQFLQDGSAFTSERSHKLQRLSEMAEEAIASGDSLLVFTQFAEVGSALEAYVARTLHYSTFYLHGGTSAAQRERMIEAFQDPETEPSVFILSLRAGGVGLNLTRANHVFHFDRWWNPSVEDQATDRAFRIGQRKNVFVHKFVVLGTVEERIDQMIEDKKRLSGLIVGADESWLTELDNDTFKDLIALRRDAVLE